jgi:hypothetical protein
MKFAYADPPYIGYSRYYKDDPNCAEVDHNELMNMMCAKFDAWALSLYTNSLKQILAMEACPDDVRIGAWVKPWASYKPGVNPGYTWEPIIFWGGRPRGRNVPTLRDWISANATMKKGLVGAKPIKVCYWIFEMLGAVPSDEFTDLYPGTGIVSRAWENWTKKSRIHDLPMFAQASS